MFIETGVNELNTLYRSIGLTKDQVYRVINSGNLEPNALTVKFGDFVRWDGSKWVKSATQLATTADVNGTVNTWIERRAGTAGTYAPEEGEEIHFGSIVVTENGLIRITSQALIDPDTGNVYYTYQTTDLSSAVVRLESQGMIDLGEKTEADLTDGVYTVTVPNSYTSLTLTTAAALTVKGNPGLGDFEILIDNSGNTNDVIVTVKSNNGQVTYLHSSAAGTGVAAGKIVQLTCVGKCWTIAEFEA